MMNFSTADIQNVHKVSFDQTCYVSCIKIKGRPILPPLMTEEKRSDMKHLREKAMELDRRQWRRAERNQALNHSSSRDSSIKDIAPSRQSTPARPMSLSLYGKTNVDIPSSQSPYSTNLRSTLEQRLALEENLVTRTRKNKQKQSPIYEDSENESKAERKRWSPLTTEGLSSLRVELAPERKELEGETTPSTITHSPRLLRQGSYTVLTPSPALLNYLENQRAQEMSQRSHSGRKTWDLRGARRNWDPSGNKLTQSMDEDYLTDDSDRRRADLGRYHSNSMDSVVVAQEAEEFSNQRRFDDDMATSVGSVGSVRSLGSVMSRPRDHGDVPSTTTEVPSCELTDLSIMLNQLEIQHKQQKLALEEKQRREKESLGMLFQKRQAELLRAGLAQGDHARMTSSLHLERPAGVLEELSAVRRPHSARDMHRPYSHTANGRSKSMDFSRVPVGQDTDLDVSFCDESIRTKGSSSRREESHMVESDSCSNMSSTSTLSSEGYFQFVIPAGQLDRYNKAATIITAAAKGFLTRRLLRTAHVQNLITILRDAITCARQLHNVNDLGDSDFDLMKRLSRQINTAWDSVYTVFFHISATERLQHITADRERLRSSSLRPTTAGEQRVAAKISSATEKSLRRKLGVNKTTTPKRRSRRACSKMADHSHGTQRNANRVK